MLPVGLNGLFHLQFPESSQCDKRVEEDGQQTETTMVPTTFTKHLVTVRGLKNNSTMTPRKAKRACCMHTKSHGNGRFTIVIFSCSF